VTNPRADAFTLDYGRGQILVEMDDWDWYQEGYNLVAGDHVIVKCAVAATNEVDWRTGRYLLSSTEQPLPARSGRLFRRNGAQACLPCQPSAARRSA
jgi:hypothetical protein